MKSAYMNQFLVIDLSTGTTRTQPVPDWLKTQYIGGKGFGARLLWDLLAPGTDGLSKDNILMFMTGPLTSTLAPAMRACAVCKSPLTNGYLDSYFGGHFGPEIKFAGYDGIIIHGKAPVPTYIWIHNDTVRLCDAAPIWGTGALEANAWIKQDLEDDTVRVATIGPAGENQVRFALISCEYNRQAGRGGAGAVMGSKNLKAIAIKGSRLVRVADPRGFQAAVADANRQISASPECQALTLAGTSYAVEWSSEVGTLPHHNFLTQDDPFAGRIGEGGQKKHLFLGKAACFGCPIRCAQMGAVRTGKFAHLITDTIEYESAAMLGSNLGIHNIKALAALTHRCDSLGVDTISMGNVIGFAFEAVQNGWIKTQDQPALAFGSVEGAQHVIDSVCLQHNDLGRLLGQGVKRASAELHPEAADVALHVRGMEVPGWAPRGTPGMGLAYMTADRGACHQRGFMVGYELGGKKYKGEAVSADGLEHKAAILKDEQDYLAGTDTLVKCDFAALGISPETYEALYTAATGSTCETGFFNRVGERIWNVSRCFNLQEGLSVEQECLPKRITQTPLTSGPLKGKHISVQDMEQLRREYYAVRGWDETGIPTDQTLQRLEIGPKKDADRQGEKKT